MQLYDNEVLLEKLYDRPNYKLNKPYLIPNKINFIAYLVIMFTTLYQFFFAPLLIKNNIYYAYTLIPCLLFVPTTGVMIHEAIHNLLNSNLTINRFMGRSLAIFIGIAFDLQRVDHLRHHTYNRTFKNCDEVYILNKCPSYKAIISYYYSNLIGVFWNDCFFTLIVCHLPKILIFRIMSLLYGKSINIESDSSLSKVIKLGKLNSIRIDGFISALLLILSVSLYESHYWIFIITFVIRSQILVILDSFAHYNTPLNDITFAKNIKMSPIFEKYIFMNFNLHGIHHIFPNVSWYYLSGFKKHFYPDFNFIYHENIFKALMLKYSVPFPIRVFPHKKIVQNFRYKY